MYIDSWECPYCKKKNSYKYEPEIIENDYFVDSVKCDYCGKESAIDVLVGINITSVISREVYNKVYEDDSLFTHISL